MCLPPLVSSRSFPVCFVCVFLVFVSCGSFALGSIVYTWIQSSFFTSFLMKHTVCSRQHMCLDKNTSRSRFFVYSPKNPFLHLRIKVECHENIHTESSICPDLSLMFPYNLIETPRQQASERSSTSLLQ